MPVLPHRTPSQDGRKSMDLGFVSAIFEELSLEEVFQFAAESGFDCVEVMCWPAGGGEQRRYAGTTHIDVDALDEEGAREINALCDRTGVRISALGYYPNPLVPDPEERKVYT